MSKLYFERSRAESVRISGFKACAPSGAWNSTLDWGAASPASNTVETHARSFARMNFMLFKSLKVDFYFGAYQSIGGFFILENLGSGPAIPFQLIPVFQLMPVFQ